MDKETEEFIVKTFFYKNKQDRMMIELLSPEKRRDALWKLCHRFRNYMNEKYIIEIPKPNSYFIDIASILKEHGAGNNSCYVMSLKEEVDGRPLPLLAALEKTVGFGLTSIVSCIPGKLAYFEAEQSFGAPHRCILKKI